MRTILESGRALQQAREQTDALFRLVRPGSLYERPIGERHRMIFYLGHVDAFDWNLIARYALDVPAFHEEFDRLFAFGIDPPPGELPNDQPTDWPSLAGGGALPAAHARNHRPTAGRGSGATPARGRRAPPDARRDVRLHSASVGLRERRCRPTRDVPGGARADRRRRPDGTSLHSGGTRHAGPDSQRRLRLG